MILNDLIGIPYTLGRHDFNKCGCFGAVHLYYKHILNKELIFSDHKIILPFWLRNRKKDIDRITDGYAPYTEKIITSINDLRPNDIMIYRGLRDDFAVGVIVNNDKCLTTNKKTGTCLMTYKKFIRFFVKGIRIDETKL